MLIIYKHFFNIYLLYGILIVGVKINKKGYNKKFADIAIPSLKIDFEYDGWFHNSTKLKDLRRDEEYAF